MEKTTIKKTNLAFSMEQAHELLGSLGVMDKLIKRITLTVTPFIATIEYEAVVEDKDSNTIFDWFKSLVGKAEKR